MGKVIIVTGATGGLGSGIVRRFGRDGNRVVVNYYRSLERAQELVQEIERAGAEAVAHQADVAKYEEVREMVVQTVARWGRLDVMVANAGGNLGMLGRTDKTLIEHDESDWDLVLNINLKGAFFSIKASAQPMMEQRDGHIVLVGSSTGIKGIVKRASYAAAKAGLLGLMKVAARELGEYNIKVNAVCPGLVIHERIADGMLKGLPKLASNYATVETVLHRQGGSPEEFADFIAYLTTMKDISGQTINTDSKILF